MSRSSHKSGVNPTMLAFDEPRTGLPPETSRGDSFRLLPVIAVIVALLILVGVLVNALQGTGVKVGT